MPASLIATLRSTKVESAAILTGGRAVRFGGRDKSALIVEGRTILERQIAELSRVTADVLIVTGHEGARTFHTGGPAFHQGHAVIPRTIADIVPESGPLGGIHAALT